MKYRLLLCMMWFLTQTVQSAETVLNRLRSDPALVGYWNMDESDGTVVRDQSPNGIDGFKTIGSIWTEGVSGNGLFMYALKGWVEVPGAEIPAVEPGDCITVSMWVNPWFPVGNLIGIPGEWMVRMEWLKLFVLTYADEPDASLGGDNAVFWSPAIQSYKVGNDGSIGELHTEEWSHVVVIWKAGPDGYFKIYVNNKPFPSKNSYSGDSSGKSGKNLVIGERIHGMVDEVYLFHRELNEQEITALYQASRSGKDDELK